MQHTVHLDAFSNFVSKLMSYNVHVYTAHHIIIFICTVRCVYFINLNRLSTYSTIYMTGEAHTTPTLTTPTMTTACPSQLAQTPNSTQHESETDND